MDYPGNRASRYRGPVGMATTKEQRAIYSKRHYAKARDKRIASASRWNKANRERKRDTTNKYGRRLRDLYFAHYGDKCACCDEHRKEFLTIEHSNGNGQEHRKAVGRGYGVILDLIERGWPTDEGFATLCWNCNIARRYGKSCPHEIERGAKSIHR
jgi:hypothetical protein